MTIKYRLQNEIFDKCILDHCAKGPLITDNNTGEILCFTCGQVLAEKTEDIGPESRTFTVEQFNQKTRTGAGTSLTIHDMGLATTIGHDDRDASGKTLSSHTKSTFSRLRIWDSRSKSNAQETNLRKAFSLLNNIKSQLGIPDPTIEEAAYIYRKTVDLKMSRGRNIESVLCASLYAACRKAGIPRTLIDIAKAANVRKRNVASTYRILLKNLDLKIEPYDPVDFLTRISTSVGASEKTKRDALNILKQAESKGLCTGKHPLVLASASVYLATLINNENKTQKEVSVAAGITSISVRNISKLFSKKLDLSHYKTKA